MKKLSSIMAVIATAIMLSSCYNRVGDLTMISSRNIDSKTNYRLIERYVVGKAKSNRGDALQTAIDNAVKKTPDGEFLKNVRIYVKNNGKEVKVEGDVWGVSSIERNVTVSVNENIEFKLGDKVVFKNKTGKIIEGTIIGINKHNAIVEYKNFFGKYVKSEFEYERLSKIK